MMQPIEIVLFGVVAVLALALIASVVRAHLRARQSGANLGDGIGIGIGIGRPAAEIASRPVEQAVPGQPMVCPACHRDYAPGLQFCPHDARQLIPANDPAARRGSPGATCPTCKRSFEPGKRFCAFDGEELVPLTVAIGGGDAGVHLAGLIGKICPNCSRRYASEATFCGRDGEELVVVN